MDKERCTRNNGLLMAVLGRQSGVMRALRNDDGSR